MSFGFGQLPPRGLTAEDLARLFDPRALGAPQGFSGSAGGTLPGDMVEVPTPPARPLSFGPAPQSARRSPPRQVLAEGMVPLPPQRPAEFGNASQADLPAEGAMPVMGQMPQAEQDGPSFGDRLLSGLRANGDYLGALGAGLLSSPTWAGGLSAGMQMAQQGEGRRAAGDLARAEMALKVQKLRKEQQGENATGTYLRSKGLSDELASAAMANPTVLSSVLGQLNKDPSIVEIGGNKYRLGANDRPSEANLLGPANAPADTTTADQKNYEQAVREGYTGTLIDYQVLKANAGKAQTTINNAVNPVLKGLGDQFVEASAGARGSADAVRSIQNARSQLDAPGGVYSGAFAENRLALQKLGSFLGVSDPAAIQNTETFRTQIKPIVLDTVKGLGAGSGISNADRDFALQAVGGDIKLDEGTIRRVLDITERSARAKIERHNRLADQMLETQPELKQIGPMLRIEVPAALAPSGEPVTGAKRLRFDPATGVFR